MPKFGSVNADGKIWAGADYGYQSPATFQALQQQGELRVGSSIMRRLGQGFNQLLDAIPGGRAYANAVGQAMAEDQAAKKKPLELIGMDPNKPTATDNAIDYLSEKSNINRDILGTGIGIAQGAIEGRIGIGAAKALRNKPRSVGAMGANRSRQMPDVFLSDDAKKAAALTGPIKPSSRVSDLNVAQLTNPPGIGPRGMQRFDVPGGPFNRASASDVAQYQRPTGVPRQLKHEVTNPSLLDLSRTGTAGPKTPGMPSDLLRPGKGSPNKDVALYPLRYTSPQNVAGNKEMRSIRERLARLSDEGKADIRIPEDIRNKNIYDQAYGSIKNPIPADDISVRLDQVFDDGLTLRSSGSSGGTVGQPAASRSSALLREIRESGDNNTKLQRTLNATHRGPGKPQQVKPKPKLTQEQKDLEKARKAAAKELVQERIRLDELRKTDPDLKEIKANSKPDAKWRREVDADIKEMVNTRNADNLGVSRSEIIRARLENKRVPRKRDLVKEASIDEFFEKAQEQIQEGFIIPDITVDNPENLSSVPLARGGRVEPILRRMGQGQKKGNRGKSTSIWDQPKPDGRTKQERRDALNAARQATEDARNKNRSRNGLTGQKPEDPYKKVDGVDTFVPRSERRGPKLTKADLPDNTNFPVFGQDGELVTSKVKGGQSKLDRSQGATGRTRATLQARFDKLVGMSSRTERQQAQLIRLKKLLNISDKVFNAMMRDR